MRLKPAEYADEMFHTLGINNRTGVFSNERKRGSEIKQEYIRVNEGDLVYNPHRVNVGSLGLVPKELDGGIVSGVYVVFRPKNPEKLPPEYLLRLLKSKTYLYIIGSYDTKHGAVRANLNWEQLCRMKVQIPDKEQIEGFTKKQAQYNGLKRDMSVIEDELTRMVDPQDANPNHMEDFNDLLKRAAPYVKPH